MKKVRILTITFSDEIKSYEVPAFRGAVIAKVGQENTLFHNHLNDARFVYRYPAIQYKQIRRRPAIVCVDEGVDEIHKFFEQRDWTVRLSGRNLDMRIDSLRMNQYTMQVWQHHFDYRINSWVALNDENYKHFRTLTTDSERFAMLEGLLKANILSFAKGIDWTVEREIEIAIKQVTQRTATLKQQKMLTFDAEFTTNVFLPNYIGLGKSVSLGFGVVTAMRSQPADNNTQA